MDAIFYEISDLTNIFSQYVMCLFLFLISLLEVGMKSNVSFVLFCALDSVFSKPLTNSRS